MATQKTDAIILGKGAINANTQSAQIFSSSAAVSIWNNSTIYADQQVIEFSGNIYRSLQAGNVNQNPATATTYWEIILKNTKDGDACFVVSGGNSDLQIRINGLWSSIGSKPYVVNLNDGQAVPAVAFSYNGSAFPYAKMEVRLRRDNSYSSASKDTYEVLNDGTTTLQYSCDGISIGPTTGVTLTPVMNAGTVEFQYTSAAQGTDITLEYTLRGY